MYVFKGRGNKKGTLRNIKPLLYISLKTHILQELNIELYELDRKTPLQPPLKY